MLGSISFEAFDDSELATLAKEFKKLGYPVYTDAVETVEAEGASRDAGAGSEGGTR